VCIPDKPSSRDAMTGWFVYLCKPKGALLVPAPRCVPPECRGNRLGDTPTLGYAGDIGAGTRGSFTQGARSIGVTAMDGIEIAKGLQEIENLRDSGQIDHYYAAAARNAFIERTADAERPAPFEGPSPLGAPIASGALSRRFPGGGDQVGPRVTDACGCKPRKEDARDPLSGWLIYYVPGGVLLTPTAKCIPYYGKPRGFWSGLWANVTEAFKPSPPPVPPQQPPPAFTPPTQPPPSLPPIVPVPPKGYLCMDPRIWPGTFRGQATPCVPPQIAYEGP